ncbi:hypothetical protein FAES_3206 [Fibrella aestuarina BUZ 2]|uniref:Uncharacterized protein n=1 Tax=Fibrella aestuarina BUZ 2 TaxID=1166018 RepID=I0KAR2_9BACT|nr:hypothetical protein [Fibrella aestuarina]CCH01215.1 hypothetical protein FAES_3206 [Fibrella aestuarina BUZ 2]
MRIERLLFLYADDLKGSNERLYERVVLEAVCRAVSRAAGRPCRQRLTLQPVTFDEVYACIPLSPGTPTHPDYAKVLSPGNVLRWLQELREAGWVRIDRFEHQDIRLTDALFRQIAWATYEHKSGGLSHPLGSPTQFVFCRSAQRAAMIHQVRQARANRQQQPQPQFAL